MRFILLLVTLIVPNLCFSSSAVYDELSKLSKDISVPIKSGSKLAVTEMVDLDGNISSLGKFIAEELITEITLLRQNEITVIERRLLMKVLDEQNMSVSELVEPEAIKNIGNLLGASAIVIGTLTELGDEIRVNARVISTKTGEVQSVARATIPVTGVIQKLILLKVKSSLARKGKTSRGTSPLSEDFFQNWGGIDIEVVGCSKNSSKITCEIISTAKEKDLVFNIHRETAVFDESGNSKKVHSIQHGNGGSTEIENYTLLWKQLILGVPLRSKISFNLTHKDASSISALRLSLSKSENSGSTGKVSVVTFRGISL